MVTGFAVVLVLNLAIHVGFAVLRPQDARERQRVDGLFDMTRETAVEAPPVRAGSVSLNT